MPKNLKLLAVPLFELYDNVQVNIVTRFCRRVTLLLKFLMLIYGLFYLCPEVWTGNFNHSSTALEISVQHDFVMNMRQPIQAFGFKSLDFGNKLLLKSSYLQNLI